MQLKIVPVGTLEPVNDLAKKWVWINANGDGGSIAVFHDAIIHICATCVAEDVLVVSESQDCPNRCGTRFYPTAWETTRRLHQI
jgi:hypothetical protein